MAKKLSLGESKTFNVAIVGLSGTEKEKGVTGVGKSCFCNRFVRPHEDDYSTNHISVISQTDFGGLIVNNDHFLYWGDVTKTADDGTEYTFQVVEQTELIDDSSFQPFKSGKSEPYYKRCANPKLQSSEKLMYICKDQLGLEHDDEYEQKYLPDGRLTIDGFLCLYDVSSVPQRPPDRQVEFVSLVLSNVLKTKKPVILVTTKQDESCDSPIKDLHEKLLARKDLAKAGLLVVETSAHDNINIDSAFLALAQLMDKTTGGRGGAKTARPKIPAYQEAARALAERRQAVTEAYWELIRCDILDYKTSWSHVHRKLRETEEYKSYVQLCGTNNAKKLYRKHVSQLREECVRERMERYLELLKALLSVLLPDLDVIADRSWPSIQRWLERQDFFDQYFLPRHPDGLSWKQLLDELSPDGGDPRIPFDLLDDGEAERVYREHLAALRAEFKRQDLKRQFKQLLEENNNVCPGKSLADVTIFFLGRECFTALSEEDKALVYAQHELELREKAKEQFSELLLEHAELFSKFEYQVTPEGLREIDECLKNEPHCQALRCIPEERKSMMLQHLGFIQTPSREKCCFREACVDYMVEGILATKARRPQSWSRSTEFLLEAEDNRINLVLLGSQGLADTLAHEIRCIDDEYTLDGQIYSLDYRPIDGDVTLPHNSFKTNHFTPHGCFCVYNSPGSLEYIQDSLEKTLLSDLQRDDRLPFQGLPIVIVLAYHPNISDKQLMHLREEGQTLADRLQCPFIDVPSSMMVDHTKRFHGDQISLAMFSLVRCIKHRSSFVNPWQIAESIEPDIRVLMCFMCGDTFNLEFPMAPLLNHQCCYVTNLDRFPTITLETYLDDNKRKVEVTVASYHGANLVRDELFHGYILVYSAKRKASLANLSTFASLINVAPTKVLAVTERGSASAFFSNEHEQNLITEGNALADSLHGASFMTTPINFQTQTASYTPFFKDCWDRKSDTESAFTFNETDHIQTHQQLTSSQKNEKWILERLNNRPPAALPDHVNDLTGNRVGRKESFTTFGKGSTSNSQSTEDSDPIYDRPHLQLCHSDSDGEHGSTTHLLHNSHSHSRSGSCDTSPYASVPIVDGRSGRLYSDAVTHSNHVNDHGNHHYHNTQNYPPGQGFRGHRTDKCRNSYPSASNPVRSYAIETTFPVQLNKPPQTKPPIKAKPLVITTSDGSSIVVSSPSTGPVSPNRPVVMPRSPRLGPRSGILTMCVARSPVVTSVRAVRPPVSPRLPLYYPGASATLPTKAKSAALVTAAGDVGCKAAAATSYKTAENKGYNSIAPRRACTPPFPLDINSLDIHAMIAATICDDAESVFHDNDTGECVGTGGVDLPVGAERGVDSGVGDNHNSSKGNSNSKYTTDDHSEYVQSDCLHSRTEDKYAGNNDKYTVGTRVQGDSGNNDNSRKSSHNDHTPEASAEKSVDDMGDNMSKSGISSQLSTISSMTRSMMILDDNSSGAADEFTQQPRYQFRKSNSMKLALNETDEASPWMVADQSLTNDYINMTVALHRPPLTHSTSSSGGKQPSPPAAKPRRLVKQATMPALICRECDTVVRGATLTPPVYSKSVSMEETGEQQLQRFMSLTPPAYRRPTGLSDPLDDKRGGPPTLPKPGIQGTRTLPQGRRASPGHIDFQKLMDVRHVIDRNHMATRTSPGQQRSLGVNSRGAPLATPEHEIEIQGEYAIVRDALPLNENEYAEVLDALPGGQVHRIRSTKITQHRTGVESTTDSEFSSLERDTKVTEDGETIYTRVNRKPTPHKKNRKSIRNPESSLPAVPAIQGPVGGKVHANGGVVGGVVDRNFMPLHGSVEKLRSNSPSEGSEGTGDEVHGIKKLKKRRSFKKKKEGVINSNAKDTTPLVGEPTLLTRSDLAGSNLNMAFIEDENSTTSLEPVSPRPGDDPDDPDTGKWKNMLGKFIPDPEKQRRKKILKEEERKLKEQQKAQKKMNRTKKDSRSCLNTSTSGISGILQDMGQSEDNLVPAFVQLCVQYIEKEGLASEGIYRVPGNKAQVDLLFEKFKEDEYADISSLDIPVNAVATGLKQFFNELTEPLIPTALHQELTEASGIKERTSRLLAVRGLVKKLPAANHQVLTYLVGHIHKVSEYCIDNKMSIENLAVCWWPTLLRPEFKDFESMSLVSKYLEDVVKLIMEQYRFIFYNENEIV